jgi:hypothetical protein
MSRMVPTKMATMAVGKEKRGKIRGVGEGNPDRAGVLITYYTT